VRVPVVGPDLTVAKDGNAEQALTTLIGQCLFEEYELNGLSGLTTMGEAVAASLRATRGKDEVGGCIA
jgi:hypothetical protein